MSGLISKTIQKLKNIFNPQNEEFLRLSLVQIDFERLRYSFNPFSQKLQPLAQMDNIFPAAFLI